MTTVPAQSFSAQARAFVIAAARFMPGVCGVLMSSSFECTTRTPWYFHFDSVGLSMPTSALPRLGRTERRASLAPRRAAVDRDHRTAHVRGAIGSQENDDVGDFV